MPKQEYKKERCECCKQTTTYALAISKGIADLVRAFSVAISKKGINAIHPGKELEVSAKEWSVEKMLATGCITVQMNKNKSFARAHGLIAKIKGQPGNWCLTTKGAEFLRGRQVPKYAIVSKVTKHNIGYWQPELYQVRITDFTSDEPTWEVPNLTIVEGRVLREEDLPKPKPRLQPAPPVGISIQQLAQQVLFSA